MKTTQPMQFDIRYLVLALSVVLIFGGLYFKFLYDVPDGEEIINMWMSWLLVVLGIIGLMVTALWKKRENPLLSDSNDSSKYGNSHKQDYDNT
jgi:heme/copper-type cytochrome/quinol oxidase subunit 2